MSFKVMTWAAAKTAGSPTAKLVLVMLADFAGELGESNYSNARLATTCEMSVDTLQRHLTALEGLGLVARIAAFRPDGSRSANKTICLYNDAARAEAIRLGWKENAESPGIEPPANCGPPAADCGGPHRSAAATPPQLCGAHNEPSDNHQRTSPPPPTGAREGGEGSFGEVKASSDIGPPNAWGRFEEAWDFSDGRESTTAAEREFDKLSAEDQAEAIEEAARVRGRSHNTVYACVWLRERRWKKARPGKPAARVTDKQLVWINADSPQWPAWQAHLAETGKPKLSAKQTNRGLGWWVERAWPPGHVAAPDPADRGREAAA